ncbi:MAG TPA: SLBB domain-containing protein, partial [Fimbriimonadaceae bacterium]|nr:SLBB domain-containing protein [Fimbriimonadaceae bacterium]
RTVLVMGRGVKNPGPYPISSGTDRLSTIIERAGGLTGNAFPEGAQFLRDPSNLRTLSQERLGPRVLEVLRVINEDEYTRALAKSEVDRARIIKSVQGSSDAPIVPGLPGMPVQPTQDNKTPPIILKGETVSRARPLTDEELEPGGNLNIDLVSVLQNKSKRDDLVLEEGDIIIVPERPSTVAVSGAVTVPSAVLFEPGRNLKYYVDLSGGYVPDAALERVLVIRARGSVVKANARTRIEVGDIIFVPTKVMAEKLSDRQSQIDQITKGITSGGIIFAIIKSLLR